MDMDLTEAAFWIEAASRISEREREEAKGE